MLDEKDLQAIAQLIDSKLEPINTRLDKMESRLDKMESRLDKMESRLDKMESDISTLKSDVSTLKSDISGIQCTLENVTNKNIKIIAESHLDNNRHTNEAENIAKDVKYSQAMQDIRLTMLEDSVSKLKKAVGID